MDQQETWSDLVAARSPALLRLAVMLTGNPADAEDLLQATLLRAQRHSGRIVGMGGPAAYLRQVMVREHLSWRRRLRRTGTTVPLPDHLQAPDPSERVDRRDATWRLLATLPPRQRAVLALRFYEDLPDQEIAALLGCSEGTVRSHASRALATLRARLTDPEDLP